MGDVPRPASSERPDQPPGDVPQPGRYSESEQAPRMGYPTTNATAIMALVSTLVPFPLLGGILGIVLGIFGLREIHRHGQTGSAVAVAAIIVGSVQVAIVLVLPILLSYLGIRLLGTRV